MSPIKEFVARVGEELEVLDGNEWKPARVSQWSSLHVRGKPAQKTCTVYGPDLSHGGSLDVSWWGPECPDLRPLSPVLVKLRAAEKKASELQTQLLFLQREIERSSRREAELEKDRLDTRQVLVGALGPEWAFAHDGVIGKEIVARLLGFRDSANEIRELKEKLAALEAVLESARSSAAWERKCNDDLKTALSKLLTSPRDRPGSGHGGLA